MSEEKWIMNEEEIDREVESLCRWAAGRAGVIVVAPVVGQIALAANEVYLIKRIANLYGKNFDEAASCAFISALGGTFVDKVWRHLYHFHHFKFQLAWV